MRVSSPSSSFLRLIPRLPVTYIPPFIFPSIICRRRPFLHKTWPIQLAFRLRISCRIFPCSLTLSNTSSFLTWSVQLIFSSTTFQDFPGCSDLLLEASMFHHHIRIYSKCIVLLVSWILTDNLSRNFSNKQPVYPLCTCIIPEERRSPIWSGGSMKSRRVPGCSVGQPWLLSSCVTSGSNAVF
jgi:hypothetical protein